MNMFSKGEAVKILAGAKYVSGNPVPSVLINTELYVIDITDDNTYKVGQSKNSKRVVGTVRENDLVSADVIDASFKPYIILTTSDVYTTIAPTYGAGVKEKLPKGRLFTVIVEDNGYGRLKNNRGWIDLDLVTKLN